DEHEPRIRLVAPSDLCRRTTIREHDVRGEVVVAADQRRTDTVGVDRDALLLELADLADGETSGDDDLQPFEAVRVECVAHLAHEPLVHPGRLEVAHLLPKRTIDQYLRRVQPHTPQLRPERA